MPYNPGIEYRGDQYLFRGISSLGEGVGAAIAKYRQNKEESQAADAAFETLVRSAAPMIQAGEIPEDMASEMQDLGKFSGLSTSAKKAKLGQMGVSLQMLQQAAEAQSRAADRQDNLDLRRSLQQLQAAEMERRQRTEDATQRGLRQLAPVMSMPADNTGIGAAYLDDALRENPEADARTLLELMQKAGDARTTGRIYPRANEMLEPFEVAGRKGMFNRMTGHTLLDPAEADGAAVPIKDENGRVIAYGVKSGNRTQVIRPPGQLTGAERTKLRERRSEIQALIRYVDDAAKQAFKDEMAQIDELLNAQSDAPAPAPSPNSGAVIMRNPDGKAVRVPADQVEAAKAKGYR